MGEVSVSLKRQKVFHDDECKHPKMSFHVVPWKISPFRFLGLEQKPVTQFSSGGPTTWGIRKIRVPNIRDFKNFGYRRWSDGDVNASNESGERGGLL